MVGAVISYLLLRIILHICYKRQLFDYIDGRKVHKIAVPRLGGMAFVPTILLATAGMLIAGSYCCAPSLPGADVGELLLGAVALLLLYIEGTADDLMGMGVRLKFLCQFLCSIIVVCSGLCLTNFSGFLGLHEVPPYVAVPFTCLLLVFIINAVNLIDGIDGLSSGLTMTILLVFGLVFTHSGNALYATISFAALGAVLPFFCFNVFGRAERKRKIFMGDCGSQTLGLLLGILAVRLSMSPDGHSNLLPAPLLIAFSLLTVPCLDTLRVMGGRIRRHRKPFSPDKTHIHHKFLALGFSHLAATSTIIGIALGFLAVNYALFRLSLGLTLIIFADFALWAVLHLTINHVLRRKGCLNYFTEREKRSGKETCKD